MSLPEQCSARQRNAGVSAAMLLPLVTLAPRLSWLWAALGAAVSLTLWLWLGPRLHWKNPPRAAAAGLGALALAAAALLSRQLGSLFPETTGLWWPGLGVLALAALTANRGLSVVLRCTAVLLVPAALICGSVLLLAAPGLHAAWMVPPVRPSDAALAALLLALPVLLLPLAPPEDPGPDRRWIAALALGAAAASVLAAGCLSPELAAQPMSIRTLARSVTVAGVMLRLEPFVSGALTASAFAGQALLLCAADRAAGTALPNLPEKNRAIYLAILAALCSALPVG